MFPSDRIPNDLALVRKAMDEYYNDCEDCLDQPLKEQPLKQKV